MKFPDETPFRVSGGATVWHLDKLYLIGATTAITSTTTTSTTATTTSTASTITTILPSTTQAATP